jgi:hypothetical protein
MSTDRGLVAEHLAMAWLQGIQDPHHRLDLAVCLGDCAADFLYRICLRPPWTQGPDEWRSMQVKRVYWKKDKGKRYPTVNLVKNGGVPYQPGDIDTVLAVDVEGCNMWLIPAEDVAGKTRLRLTKKWFDCWRPVVNNNTLKPEDTPTRRKEHEALIAPRPV